jgi:hypothetical protein
MSPTITSAVFVRAGSALRQTVAPVAESSANSFAVLSAKKMRFAENAGEVMNGCAFSAPAGASFHRTSPVFGWTATTHLVRRWR